MTGLDRQAILAAFGVTEADLAALDPDSSYAQAREQAAADRETFLDYAESVLRGQVAILEREGCRQGVLPHDPDGEDIMLFGQDEPIRRLHFCGRCHTTLPAPAQE